MQSMVSSMRDDPAKELLIQRTEAFSDSNWNGFRCGVCKGHKTQDKYVIWRHLREEHGALLRNPASIAPPMNLFKLGPVRLLEQPTRERDVFPTTSPPSVVVESASLGNGPAAQRPDEMDPIYKHILCTNVWTRYIDKDFQGKKIYSCKICGPLVGFTSENTEDIKRHVTDVHFNGSPKRPTTNTRSKPSQGCPNIATDKGKNCGGRKTLGKHNLETTFGKPAEPKTVVATRSSLSSKCLRVLAKCSPTGDKNSSQASQYDLVERKQRNSKSDVGEDRHIKRGSEDLKPTECPKRRLSVASPTQFDPQDVTFQPSTSSVADENPVVVSSAADMLKVPTRNPVFLRHNVRRSESSVSRRSTIFPDLTESAEGVFGFYAVYRKRVEKPGAQESGAPTATDVIPLPEVSCVRSLPDFVFITEDMEFLVSCSAASGLPLAGFYRQFTSETYAAVTEEMDRMTESLDQ